MTVGNISDNIEFEIHATNVNEFTLKVFTNNILTTTTPLLSIHEVISGMSEYKLVEHKTRYCDHTGYSCKDAFIVLTQLLPSIVEN